MLRLLRYEAQRAEGLPGAIDADNRTQEGQWQGPAPEGALHTASDFSRIPVSAPDVSNRDQGPPAAYPKLSVPSSVHEVLRSQGQPLDPLTRAAMEQRFGHDFSRVRVHTDSVAELSARDVNARAYTVGTEIVFGAHKFAPEDREGRILLAHELTHVLQQRNAPIDISALEPQGSAAEREADAAASDVTAGRAAKRPSAAPRGIPRDVGWASRAEIPDVHGMGYNTIYKNAGPDSKGAVLALASLETPRMFVDIERYKKLEAPVRKSILALAPHAAGTACARWFDLLHANDPDFKPTLTRQQERTGEAAYYASTRQAQLDALAAMRARWGEELPGMTREQIISHWEERKEAFVAVASSPGHGLNDEQLFEVWKLDWIDRLHAAESRVKEIERNEAAKDPEEFRQKLGRFEFSYDYDVLGPEYRQARADVDTGYYLLRNIYDILVLLPLWAESRGISLTLQQATEAAFAIAEWHENMVAALAMVVPGGGLRNARGLGRGQGGRGALGSGRAPRPNPGRARIDRPAPPPAIRTSEPSPPAPPPVPTATVEPPKSPKPQPPGPLPGTSTPKVEFRTPATPDLGKPAASGSPRGTTTRPMKKLPGGASRGSMSQAAGDPVAHPKSRPTVEARTERTLDYGKPESSADPKSQAPDPWKAPQQPTKPTAPRAPAGHHPATGQAAKQAQAQGLQDLQKGRVGMQEHRTAPAVREATGQAGQGVESTHLVPQAAYKALGLNPDLAQTVNLPEAVNKAIDSAWVSKWKNANRLGQQVTGGELRKWVTEGIRNVPENMLSQTAKNTLEWRLNVELKELGISDDTIILYRVQ